MIDGDALLTLLRGEFASLSIDCNETPALNYASVAEFDDETPDFFNWISPEQRQLARERNRAWTIQWYPDTPVGSYNFSAGDLTVLLQYVFDHRKDF